MGQIGSIIVGNAKTALWLAEGLSKDIEPQRFARLIQINGEPVRANHPAFVFGHLAVYPQQWNRHGVPGDIPSVPESWPTLFDMGAECKDDPDGRIYPPKNEILERYFAGHRAALEGIAQMSDEQFAAPLPEDYPLAKMCPTIGAAIEFYALFHPTMHLGQVSTWRRCMGLGPVF